MSTDKQYKYTLPVGYKLRCGSGEYVIEEVLGRGGFGITYKVMGHVFTGNIPVDMHFAVKEYFPDICWRGSDNATMNIPLTRQNEVHNGLTDFLNEGLRLQKVCTLSPYIVNVNEVFEANGTAYYVLEYLDGGDLRKMVEANGGTLGERQMLDVMVPVGHAVQCLHDNNILHLDIKPDNIVMRRNYRNSSVEPVLIDFGIATHFNKDGTPTSKTPTQGVSPGYSPVEQYALVKHFDPRIDVYSFCATCLYLLTGKDPEESMNLMHQPANYIRSKIPTTVSDKVATAIAQGMSINKTYRTATISEVLSQFAAAKVPPTYMPSPKPSPTAGSGTVSLGAQSPPVTGVVGDGSGGKSNDTSSQPPLNKKPDEGKKNTPTPPKKRSKKKKIAVAIILAIAMIAIIAGVVSMVKSSSSTSESGASYIDVSNDNLSFAFEGGEENVDVGANGSWDVDECPEWVTTEIDDNMMVIKVKSNDSGRPREGDIVLAGKDDVTATIHIKQATKCTHITPASETIEFDKAGGTKTVAIATDGGDIKVEASGGFSATYANGTLTIIAPANGGGSKRGEIKLTCEDQVAAIVVTQEGNKCQRCNGTGKITCPKCNGRGLVPDPIVDRQIYDEVPCENCGGYWNGKSDVDAVWKDGSGRIKCPDCGGTGHK